MLERNPANYGEFAFRSVRLTACADLRTKRPLAPELPVTCHLSLPGLSEFEVNEMVDPTSDLRPPGYTTFHWLRGLPENRFCLGTIAPLPDMRPRRMLRLLAKPSRAKTFSPLRPPNHSILRLARAFRKALGLTVARRGED